MHIFITKYTPMRLGRFFTLPPALIKRKHALLNIKNRDDRLVFLNFSALLLQIKQWLFYSPNSYLVLFFKSSYLSCLLWCTIAAKHPYTRGDSHASELAWYKQYEEEIVEDGITWPITLSQIDRFERLNK